MFCHENETIYILARIIPSSSSGTGQKCSERAFFETRKVLSELTKIDCHFTNVENSLWILRKYFVGFKAKKAFKKTKYIKTTCIDVVRIAPDHRTR